MSRRGGKVMVALSGGVDSAVAALLLLREGHDVEALHMSNWEDDAAYCTAAADYQDARSVCRELGIPLHRVNFGREYRERVFADFLREYAAGRTPNPDVLCNREIKFGVFLEHARRLGAGQIATGHYARIRRDPVALLRGLDRQKDQSYFLHAVPAAALTQTMFPLGELYKTQVREMATAAGLPVNEKRDSTGICFIGERPFRDFLQQYLEAPEGPIETPEGEEIGRHGGLMFYTRGQRQGLGIGGHPRYPGKAWYVAGKACARNVLIVAAGRSHPSLWDDALHTGRPCWINGPPPELAGGSRLDCSAQTRYRQSPAACQVARRSDGGLDIRFATAQWAVTPGQYAVLYRGDLCLGGAVIEGCGTRAAPLAMSA